MVDPVNTALDSTLPVKVRVVATQQRAVLIKLTTLLSVYSDL